MAVLMNEIPAFNADQPGPNFTSYIVGPFDASRYDEFTYGIACASANDTYRPDVDLTANLSLLLSPVPAIQTARLGVSASIGPAPVTLVGAKSGFTVSPHQVQSNSAQFPNLATNQIYVELDWGYNYNPYPISFSIWVIAGLSAWHQGSPDVLTNKTLTLTADGSDEYGAAASDFTTVRVQAGASGSDGMALYLEQLSPGGWISPNWTAVYGGSGGHMGWVAATNETFTQGPYVDYLAGGDQTTAQQTQGCSIILPRQRIRWAAQGPNSYPVTISYSALGMPYPR